MLWMGEVRASNQGAFAESRGDSMPTPLPLAQLLVKIEAPLPEPRTLYDCGLLSGWSSSNLGRYEHEKNIAEMPIKCPMQHNFAAHHEVVIGVSRNIGGRDRHCLRLFPLSPARTPHSTSQLVRTFCMKGSVQPPRCCLVTQWPPDGHPMNECQQSRDFPLRLPNVHLSSTYLSYLRAARRPAGRAAASNKDGFTPINGA
jgi:hypothetical protein